MFSEAQARSRLATVQQSYQLCLGSPAGKAMLEDLALMCRANESCFDPDARMHAYREGKRVAYIRLIDFRDMTIDELYAKYTTAAKET